ncbi:hypothetical protein [Stieleria tagensis]|uniref:hypothetical protein n=1 Tax=Stieleria tagensis TaxID=2956795 RepID=UPI00209AB97F|nr:hypothetical protein [Stieleria tagensis]
MEVKTTEGSTPQQCVLVEKDNAPLSVEEVRQIEGYCNSTYIRMFHVRRLNLTCLKDWINLKRITLRGCHVVDDEQSLSMDTLESVEFGDDLRKLPNLNLLVNTKQLRRIDLVHIPHMNCIPQLKNPSQVKSIDVQACGKLSDPISITQFVNLETLKLLNCGFEADSVTEILGKLDLSEAVIAVRDRRKNKEIQTALVACGFEPFPSGKRIE